MRTYTDLIEINGKPCVSTYQEGRLWANWEISGNAPDDTEGVTVPDGWSLVTGSVRIRKPIEPTGDAELDWVAGVGLYDHPLMDWTAIKDDLSGIMRCKNHYE